MVWETCQCDTLIHGTCVQKALLSAQRLQEGHGWPHDVYRPRSPFNAALCMEGASDQILETWTVVSSAFQCSGGHPKPNPSTCAYNCLDSRWQWVTFPPCPAISMVPKARNEQGIHCFPPPGQVGVVFPFILAFPNSRAAILAVTSHHLHTLEWKVVDPWVFLHYKQ